MKQNTDTKVLCPRCVFPSAIRGWRYSPIWVVALLTTIIATTSIRADELDSKQVLRRRMHSAFDAGVKILPRSEIASTLEIHFFGNTTRVRVIAEAPRPSMVLDCLLCSPAELLSQTRRLGATWAGAALGRSPATLSLSNANVGDVWIDGVPVPPNENRHPLMPGPVTVVVKNGETVKRGRLDTTAGELHIDVNDLKEERVDRRIPAGIVLTGLATSAAAISGILLSMHGDCSDSTCHYSYELMSGGVISMIISATLQTAAGVLFATAGFSSR